eukprot:1656417-Pyramimonas_sp.AAC.1
MLADYVFPKACKIPMVDEVNGRKVVDTLGSQLVGRLRVKVVKCYNLPNADWSFTGNNLSDPYVKVRIRL